MSASLGSLLVLRLLVGLAMILLLGIALVPDFLPDMTLLEVLLLTLGKMIFDDWGTELVWNLFVEQSPGYEDEQLEDPGQAEHARPGWYILRPTKFPPGP